MIKINNLDFAYKNTQVFKNISLEFKKGNIYGLLGENGVGKTTLLKLICGLQKPQLGSVTVDGFTPSMRQPEFLQNVYFLPEEVITEDTTPEKFVQKIGVFYPRYDFALFNQLMKELEVDLSKKFHELSHDRRRKPCWHAPCRCKPTISSSTSLPTASTSLRKPCSARFLRTIAPMSQPSSSQHIR